MRYIPSLSIITLTVVRASIDDPAEAPAKKSFGHSVEIPFSISFVERALSFSSSLTVALTPATTTSAYLQIKRFLSRSKSRKDVVPAQDHAFFYNLHRPQNGSEFSSLSASNGPAIIPGHKCCQGVLSGFLPSPTKLDVVRGEVSFGEISLKFVEEAISGDGGESTAFVRLVEAKCPVIEDILAPPTGLLRYYAYDYSFPSAIDATVFPADIRRVQHGSESDEEEYIQSRLLDPRLSEGSGMYEIRINGKSDDALKKALELLYAAVPAPSWAHKSADLSTMTANEYLILTLCLHIRGGDSLVSTHPSTTFGSVERAQWMGDYHVKSKDTAGRRPSQLIVEVCHFGSLHRHPAFEDYRARKGPQNVTATPLSKLRSPSKLEVPVPEENALMNVKNSYDLALGTRPDVNFLKVGTGACCSSIGVIRAEPLLFNMLRSATGYPSSSSRTSPWNVHRSSIVKAGEAEVAFGMDEDKILVLEDVKCPRWSRPTPRKLVSVHHGTRIFPAIFDDAEIFMRKRVYSVGVLVSAVKTGSVLEAVKTLFHVIRKPRRSVGYTKGYSPANEYLITAICSGLLTSPADFWFHRPLSLKKHTDSSGVQMRGIAAAPIDRRRSAEVRKGQPRLQRWRFSGSFDV